ncbi:MAG: hypothetical protein K6F50_04295 [Kiritimatiellae bacterium]|nr:hypothetical protein [Kiritimatiellia bacterium]
MSLAFHAAAICLPTLAVFLFAARFCIVELPRVEESERDRVEKSCERVADGLLADPSRAGFVWRRGEGIVSGDASFSGEFPAGMAWKDWRAISSEPRKKARAMRGWRILPDGMLVWVRDTVRGRDAGVVYGLVADISETDYRSRFLVYGGFSLFVLAGMTFIGVKYFVDYVRTRDDFLAATAHDLTTPLVGMRYLIGSDAEGAAVLNERLLRLVSNIKDFMRLGGKRPPPARKPFDIVRAYGEAYSLFRDDYRDLLGGDVQTEVPDGLPQVLADETLAVQILWNLLGNDLKYAAPFGKVSVRFRVAKKGSVAVDFIDFGKGMSRRERSRAFDRYYRAKTVLVSGKGGFGIGLSASREFARSMGGDLTVGPNRPSGCIFTLTLPAAPA